MAYILIIEDDADLRHLLKTVLHNAGHQVAVAGDGSEGIQMYRAEPTDLVITDIVMPRTEGGETIRTLRREYPGLGIIAISGGTSYSRDWLKLATQLGAARTLAKPFDMARLNATIREVLAAHPDPLGAGGDEWQASPN